MIIHKEESYKIVGAAFKVYNNLGAGFLEAVYQEALEIEFQRQGIPYEREKELKIQYDGIELKQTYKADLTLTDLKFTITFMPQVSNWGFCLTLAMPTNYNTKGLLYNEHVEILKRTRIYLI